jgi:excisionase family DNA binding protein
MSLLPPTKEATVPEQWFTVREVSERFGVSSRTIRRLIEASELKAINVRHQIRISEAECARFAKAAAR